MTVVGRLRSDRGDTAVKNTLGLLGGLGALAVLLLLLNAAMNGGELGGPERDHEVRAPAVEDEDRKIVVLTVVAGRFTDGKFEGSGRDLTITYWVNGERFAADRDEPEGGPWNEILALSSGAEVRLLVEQHGEGGFLMCNISSEGRTLSPNGYMHRNDAGDCDVNGVVP